MKKKYNQSLRIQTVANCVLLILLVFFITTGLILLREMRDGKKTLLSAMDITSDKKALELDFSMLTIEKAVLCAQDYILRTIDEERILRDSSYEKEFMANLAAEMISLTEIAQNAMSLYFRMSMERFGGKRGFFLEGDIKKGFVSVKPTDLSLFSPNDIEHVGWYYIPLWKKAPVWTPPYENKNLGTDMISFVIPVYKNNEFLGVVGMDINLATIKNIIDDLPNENQLALLITEEGNLIYFNNAHLTQNLDLLKQSADISTILDIFKSPKKGELSAFNWNNEHHYGLERTLKNNMKLIVAISDTAMRVAIQKMILPIVVSFIIVIILMIIALFFTLKNILVPIRIITDATFRMARGELNIKIPYESKNELGHLSSNIRMMTTQMKEYIEYIHEQTKKEREEKEVAISENKSKSTFLANMSHEIRTPINAVLGMDEMILRECEDKTILGYASSIKTAGTNLLSIVNDILDFSKIEAGKMELIPENYDISSLVVDLVNMIRERAKKKGLDFILKTDPTIPKTLFGDSVRLKQCILNLLTNAVKYTHEGSVTFTIGWEKCPARPENIFLKASVRDTGIGIKEEDMKRLFSPFERIEEGKNRTIEGTGLGISIVKKMLDMMGTHLDVKSTYGAGSVFSFDVEQKVIDWQEVGDINEAYSNSIEQIGKYKETLHASKAHLLFVDDTDMNLEVIRCLLKKTRIKLDTVLSGKEALEKVSQNCYDILFIDHRMPEMDGIETLHAMKKMPENKSAGKPCVALTANALSDAKKMYLDEGFTDYLSKPVNPEALEKMIRHYLPEEYIEDDFEETDEEAEPENSEILEKLRSIEGLDPDAAIANCGTYQILETAVKNFYNSYESMSANLKNFFAIEDWENYCTKVHALKSSSRLIGIMELSKKAEYLEEMSDKEKVGEIQAKHPELMELYENFTKKLEEIVKSGEDDSQKPEISEAELKEKLSRLKICADNLDMDGMDAIMLEFADFAIPPSFAEKFAEISTAATNVDFKKLRDLLKE